MDLEIKADTETDSFRKALFIMHVAEIMRSERMEALTKRSMSDNMRDSFLPGELVQIFCQNQFERDLFVRVVISAYSIAKQLRTLRMTYDPHTEGQDPPAYIRGMVYRLIDTAERARHRTLALAQRVTWRTAYEGNDPLDLAHCYLHLAEMYNLKRVTDEWNKQ